MRAKRNKSQAGFSLIEMMIVVAILIVVLGVVLRQVTVMQMRSRGEAVKLDMVQQARESLDQMVRDLHQAGYPSAYMYMSTVLTSPTNNNTGYATGLVQVVSGNSAMHIFEGDVDGDGAVDSVRYRYVTSSAESTHCPCIERSQVTKTAANPLTGQNTAYHVLVENVATNGLTFTAYNSAGGAVSIGSGLDINSSSTTLKSIKTLQIALSVQGQTPDLQTRQFPAAVLNGLAQIRN